MRHALTDVTDSEFTYEKFSCERCVMNESNGAHRSWSWPSVDGVIHIPARVWQHRDYALKILEQPRLELVDSGSPMAQLSSGLLHVQGRLYRLTFSATKAQHASDIGEGSALTGVAEDQDLVKPEWRLNLNSNSPNDHSPWCSLYPDDPIDILTVHACTGGASIEDTVNHISMNGSIFVLTCRILLLFYTKSKYGGSTPCTYSGYGVALGQTTEERHFHRIGVVEFRGLPQDQWIQVLLTRITPAGASLFEASDPTGDDIITLV